MSAPDKIPSIGGRLVEMLVGNDQTGKDLAAMFSLPLMAAGVSKIAHIGNEALGSLSPNLPASVPVIAQGQGQGNTRSV